MTVALVGPSEKCFLSVQEVLDRRKKKQAERHAALKFVKCEGCKQSSGTLIRSTTEERIEITHWTDKIGHRHQQTHHRSAYRHKACIKQLAA